MQELEFDKEELGSNPATRLPLGLCLDVSTSTKGAPHLELVKGVEAFYKALWDDESTRDLVEVAIATFASDVDVVQEFSPIESATAPEIPHTGGVTRLGAGFRCVLDLLEDRKSSYQRSGVQYYQPWIVVISDGAPTDDEHLALASRVEQLVDDRKLTVFAIGVGSGVDLSALAVLSPQRPPLRLKGLNFPKLFEFLSDSASRVSRSQPGEKPRLDTFGMEAWGEA